MFHRIVQSPISLRLPAMIVLALATCIGSTVYFFSGMYSKDLKERQAEVTSAVAAQTIEDTNLWIAQIGAALHDLDMDRSSAELLGRLGFVFRAATAPSLDALRTSYITQNTNPAGEREKLSVGSGAGPYDSVHAQFHEHFRGIAERNGFYDIFFILPNGDVVYSVEKEDDYGTNLLNGPYAQTGLAEAFTRALNSATDEDVFVDFAPYGPSGDSPAAFMAHEVLDADGTVAGVVAFQLPIESLSAQLSSTSLLAAEDELYLMGADGLSRTAARHPERLDILQPVPQLEHIALAEPGASIRVDGTTGLTDRQTFAAVESFDVFGETWYAIVERDLKVANAPLRAFNRLSALAFAVGFAASLIIGLLIARSITGPIERLTEDMRRVAEADYDHQIDGVSRQDEFGLLSRTLDTFRVSLLDSRSAAEMDAERSLQQAVVVDALGNGLRQLSEGDLTANLNEPFAPEYEELRLNFNATLETLNDLMRTIVENSNEIHARAEEISASSDDLSHRTENQAATLEQTAAALDELTASVREAAESASEVEDVVTKTRRDAEDSGAVVSEAVEAMSLIRKSSGEISQIIGVIDDIAFQTNLLSLNAGVEAARAGDAGRGFAVVASEVRALAQRSSEAAKQIKALITSSTEQVESGVGLVGRTGEALGSIIERVSNIDRLVSGIASGSREQSTGLGEINVGMSQLDQVTQQNAAMVEEATAAATTLRNEAVGLTQVVSRFKLSGSTALPSGMGSAIPMAPPAPSPARFDAPDNFAPKKAVNADGWADF